MSSAVLAEPCLSTKPEDHTLTLQIRPRYNSEELRSVTARYRWLGNPHGPVVVVQGGTSSGRHVDTWWRECIGERCVIDTRYYRVLGVEYLSTEVPHVSTEDQAEAVHAILTHHSVQSVYAHIGASYGGMVGLALAAWYPTLLDHLVVISAAHRADAMSTAVRVIQRRITELDTDPREALAVARALAVTTYRSTQEFSERFTDSPVVDADLHFSVESYLDHVGEKFVRSITPEHFRALSASIDLHNITPETIHTPVTLIGVGSDRAVPITLMRELAQRLTSPTALYEIESVYGHDTFLKTPQRVTQCLAPLFNKEDAR